MTSSWIARLRSFVPCSALKITLSRKHCKMFKSLSTGLKTRKPILITTRLYSLAAVKAGAN